MKKMMVYQIVAVLIIIICVIIFSDRSDGIIEKPYTQEYIIGDSNIKGNVNVKNYTDISSDFDIGANEDGYPVFKDPHQALETLKVIYDDILVKIQDDNNLEELSYDTYEKYIKYSGSFTFSSFDDTENAIFVNQFLDIYANSFEVIK